MVLQRVDDGGGGVLHQGDALLTFVRGDAGEDDIGVVEAVLHYGGFFGRALEDLDGENGRSFKIWEGFEEFVLGPYQDFEGEIFGGFP